MYINTQDRQKQYLTSIKNGFYTFCRNAEVTSLEEEAKANEIIEILKTKYPKEETGIYYFRIVEYIKDLTIKNQISKNDALIILIFSIDPDFQMYYIYDELCRLNKVKKEIKEHFYFYDDAFLELEKKYIKNNNLEKKYGWEYKKEE